MISRFTENRPLSGSRSIVTRIFSLLAASIFPQRSMTAATWSIHSQVIFSFMFPIFAGLLLQQLYNIVDTFVVGNFSGEAPLAAVGACGVLTIAFLSLANGFSVGGSVLIAQHFGAGEKTKIRGQASSALLLMLGIGAVATVAGIFISRFTLKYIRIYQVPIPILSPNPSPCGEAAAQSAVEIYREIIKDNIDYHILKQDIKFDGDRLDEIVDLINGNVYVRLENAAQAAGFTRNANGNINVPQDGS